MTNINPSETMEAYDRLKTLLREMFQLDRGDLDFGLYRIMNLKADEKGEITIQPVPLNDGKRQVVQSLTTLAKSGTKFLHGHELFLIRNRTRGRGVSFFDDHSYYPDFIVWLTVGSTQHVIFLDPKGLTWFGPNERQKVRLHTEIAKIGKQIQKRDPNLYLHAYILSVTPPEKIGDMELSTQVEWKKGGLFSDESRMAPADICTCSR